MLIKNSYKNRLLYFHENYITHENTNHSGRFLDSIIMHDCEHPIMAEHAKICTENGGDILEVGFGMGISANYIQSHNISSHTIIENHPQVIEKAIEWSKDKSNVTIITGSWYEVKDNLPTYDGLFYDTFGDDDMQYFSSSLSSLVKSGGVTTWWNILPEENNYYNIPNVTYNQ